LIKNKRLISIKPVAYLATKEKTKKNQHDCNECDKDGYQKRRFIH